MKNNYVQNIKNILETKYVDYSIADFQKSYTWESAINRINEYESEMAALWMYLQVVKISDKTNELTINAYDKRLKVKGEIWHKVINILKNTNDEAIYKNIRPEYWTIQRNIVII